MTSKSSDTTRTFLLSLNNKVISVADLNKRPPSKRPIEKSKPKGKTTPKEKQPNFSPRSRNKLIKAVNSLSEPPEFLLTLSYPDGVSTSSKDWKKDLDRFARRIRHHYPDSWWIWRIEPQTKTGKPHYHIIGSTADRVKRIEFWKWVHQKWSRIVGVDPTEAKFVTRVQEVTETEGKLERYICKPERNSYKQYKEAWTTLTNRWGKINGLKIPADEQVYKIDEVTLSETKELILASIQSQIDELQKKHDAMTDFTPHKERRLIEKSIAGKKQHMFDIKHRYDFFSILDDEHISLIQRTVTDKQGIASL